ncbi:ABC transporter permease subunit [Variovorax ginsengisoli]|uniref:Spermidine/putrescine transport system permease protein n=1 Tax=Variovorax ginsengisoli TaxID=363844 RepID=A0ABT9S4U2_9BURK|nr:ABC transporter permease subunit [Variovorax ginsengisoli]MDP9899370.1 putative spermidine/putrescine transport system permease protein [Variovorax ginsengisoli]
MTAATVLGVRWTRAGRGAVLRNPAWLLLPALAFLALFYVLPLIDLLRLSVAGDAGLSYFARVFAVPLYWDSLVRTFGIAATVALLCALFGYPTALLVHCAQGLWRLALLAAIVLPYFISVLIRTYSWMVLLGRNGPINKLLLGVGLIDAPLPLIFNRASVLISISAVLLPLMVLTVLGSLARLDPLVQRAAAASGAGPLAAFWRVVFPLTLPGLLAGLLLVFISALGFFITPSLLGGPGDQMFAMHITQQADFLASGGFLQALAAVLLAVTLAVVGVAGRFLGFEFIWGGQRATPVGAREVRPPSRAARWRAALAARLADALGWPLLRALGRIPALPARLVSRALAAFALLTLLLPIGVGALISFSNAVYMSFPPPSYSLRWYVKFLADPVWLASLMTSAQVAVLATLISVLLGTTAALGLVRSSLPGKSAWMTFLVSPLIVPGVVLGLSLYSLFLRADLVGGVWGLAAAHAIGGIPLVLVIVAAALQSVDVRQEQAAAVHGASPLRVFRFVTLPAIGPSMAAAAFFAFLHSFDDLVFAMFLSGSRMTTLPLRLWGNVNYKLDPVPAVVATFEVALILVGLFLARAAWSARRTPH